MAQNKIDEFMKKVWPKSKQDLERGVDQTKKLLEQGERYLRDVSKKGVKNAKKLSLSLERERLYYQLGKTVARIPRTKWAQHRRLMPLIKKIKSLDIALRRVK